MLRRRARGAPPPVVARREDRRQHPLPEPRRETQVDEPGTGDGGLGQRRAVARRAGARRSPPRPRAAACRRPWPPRARRWRRSRRARGAWRARSGRSCGSAGMNPSWQRAHRVRSSSICRTVSRALDGDSTCLPTCSLRAYLACVKYCGFRDLTTRDRSRNRRRALPATESSPGCDRRSITGWGRGRGWPCVLVDRPIAVGREADGIHSHDLPARGPAPLPCARAAADRRRRRTAPRSSATMSVCESSRWARARGARAPRPARSSGR